MSQWTFSLPSIPSVLKGSETAPETLKSSWWQKSQPVVFEQPLPGAYVDGPVEWIATASKPSKTILTLPRLPLPSLKPHKEFQPNEQFAIVRIPLVIAEKSWEVSVDTVAATLSLSLLPLRLTRRWLRSRK